jgi:hypothetical protein
MSMLFFDSSEHDHYGHSAQGQKILGLSSQISCSFVSVLAHSSSFVSSHSEIPPIHDPRILASGAEIMIQDTSSHESLETKEPDVTV